MHYISTYIRTKNIYGKITPFSFIGPCHNSLLKLSMFPNMNFYLYRMGYQRESQLPIFDTNVGYIYHLSCNQYYHGLAGVSVRSQWWRCWRRLVQYMVNKPCELIIAKIKYSMAYFCPFCTYRFCFIGKIRTPHEQIEAIDPLRNDSYTENTVFGVQKRIAGRYLSHPFNTYHERSDSLVCPTFSCTSIFDRRFYSCRML